ncbi:hypothetical protein EGW08_011843, partial [Elysia chlorotica]
WQKSLPPEDHVWLSRALFTDGRKLRDDLQSMWFYPPEPPVVFSSPPESADIFFRHRFFLWMPHRIWGFPFVCSQPGCARRRLNSCGLYRTVRRVIDQVDDYYMGTENLECARCHKMSPGWSLELLGQLGYVERSQFPAVLSYHHALDKKVVAELRDRSVGNGSLRMFRKIQEMHTDDHDLRTMRYYAALQKFVGRIITTGPLAKGVPPFRPVPSSRWIRSVYLADVYMRLDGIKAQITATFGKVLKMGSTKSVIKKLSGSARDSAASATSVGNEYGQVLMCVLAASEGPGLQAMAQGLVHRYATSGVPQPKVLYVDRGCCGKCSSKAAQDLFSEWRDLTVRLDASHFMFRFVTCLSAESHALRETFMKKLSSAIFKWNESDVATLRQAKVQQLQSVGRRVTEATVELTSKELSAHCRRITRCARETEAIITRMLTEFKGGTDVRVFNLPRLERVWEEMKVHVKCLQDPADVSLYTVVSRKSLGGVSLPVYHCTRGISSVENFYPHLNNFIPGESASDVHFQAYLLEGLARWNERHRPSTTHSDVNKLSRNFELQRALVDCAIVVGANPGVKVDDPIAYTGELIGVQYLFSQTGQDLDTLCPDLNRSLPEGPGYEDEEESVEETTILSLPLPPTRPQQEPLPSSSPPLQQQPPSSSPPLQQQPPSSSPPLQQQPPSSSPPLQQQPPSSSPPLQQQPPSSSPPLQQQPPSSSPPLQQQPPSSSPPLQQQPPSSSPPLQVQPAQPVPHVISSSPPHFCQITSVWSDYGGTEQVQLESGSAAETEPLAQANITTPAQAAPSLHLHEKVKDPTVPPSLAPPASSLLQRQPRPSSSSSSSLQREPPQPLPETTRSPPNFFHIESVWSEAGGVTQVQDEGVSATEAGSHLQVNIPVPSDQGTIVLRPSPLLGAQTLHAGADRLKKRRRVKDNLGIYKRATHTCRVCGQPKRLETGHRGYRGYSFCPTSVESYDTFLIRVKTILQK